MLDAFFLIGLPYIALVVLVVGSLYRYRTNAFSYSSLSSQFLESRLLLAGTVPWHVGIGIVFLGHVAALFFPQTWIELTAHRPFLVGVECLGMAAAMLSILGVAVLLVRRVTNPRVQAVTTGIDLLVLIILLAQVTLGFSVAIGFRWGSAWSTGTLTPYFWSILTLSPDMAFVSELPGLVKIHIILASFIFILLPFSRLVHIFSIPIAFIFRPPQKVVWTRGDALREHAKVYSVAASKREFLKGSVALASGAAVVSAGGLYHLSRYFMGPTLNDSEEQSLLAEKLERLKLTTEEKQLELERKTSEHLFVAKITELLPDKGKYFIDYHMAPALAFLGSNQLPLLISAKCTHLGCTVGNQIDKDGNILCPCHVSYFSVLTGMPNDGAPAKDPLPHIGFVIKDSTDTIIYSQDGNGHSLDTVPTEQLLKTAGVFIAKKFVKERA